VPQPIGEQPEAALASEPGVVPLPRQEMPGGSEPIPFPHAARIDEVAEAAEPPEAPPVQAPAPEIQIRRVPPGPRPASGHFAETSRPTRIESVFSLADALDEIADEPVGSRADAFEPPARQPVPDVVAPAPADADDRLPDYLAFNGGEPAPATAAEEIVEVPPPDAATSSKVSDLEREMARLLGEITSKRGG
jgi:hypothetical protein